MFEFQKLNYLKPPNSYTLKQHLFVQHKWLWGCNRVPVTVSSHLKLPRISDRGSIDSLVNFVHLLSLESSFESYFQEIPFPLPLDKIHYKWLKKKNLCHEYWLVWSWLIQASSLCNQLTRWGNQTKYMAPANLFLELSIVCILYTYMGHFILSLNL